MSRSPGRPRADEPPVLDRAVLLEAAARSLQDGYAGFSVRALARELGVSQSAVQHYARTKQELLRLVVSDLLIPTMTAVLTRVRELAVAAPGDVDVALLLRQRVRALAAHAGLVSAVLSDRSPGAEGRRTELLAVLAPLTADGADVLRALADAGVIRPIPDVAWTALTLWAFPAVSRAWPVLEELGMAGGGTLAQVLDEIADLLTWGVVPRRGPYG